MPQKLFEKVPYQTPHFLSEENSATAADLKSALASFFETADEVVNAYLVRAAYSSRTNAVVLCLTTKNGRQDPDVARQSGAIFSRMFLPNESMDILFANKDQEHEIRHICQPFFSRSHQGFLRKLLGLGKP